VEVEQPSTTGPGRRDGFTTMHLQQEETRQAQRAAQQLKEEEKMKKKTLSGKLGELVAAKLVRQLGVRSEEDIPEGLVWRSRWAGMEGKLQKVFVMSCRWLSQKLLGN